MVKHNLIREIRELKNQLAYSKRYGFFFGAGTSCALGVPNIAVLTSTVKEKLEGEKLKAFKNIHDDLKTTHPDKTINIEDILNQLRQIRSLTGEREDKSYLGISGKSAKQLDKEICKLIYQIISEKEDAADLSNPKKFLAWYNMQNRNYSKEIFTSNYDLIFEKSLEEIRAPYFDGFIGAYEPFFWQEGIDLFVVKSDLTHDWIRLWKIHGSLNWFWKEDTDSNTQRIIRRSKLSDIDEVDNELVIYPSREKYASSKKQPFVAYFDRLKKVLLDGKLLFIFSGYSFADLHITEVIFSSLWQNKRLFVLVFCY